jgi:hypothetical protein
MFPHPEDLYRLHQQQHAEMIRSHTRERQARAAHQPSHRLREIGLHVSGFVPSRRWWKGITSLFNRHNHQAGAGLAAGPGQRPGELADQPEGRSRPSSPQAHVPRDAPASLH